MSEKEMFGIKEAHLERIIELIRTRFVVVKEGTKYLENMERKYNITALANIRDFVSHIETALKEDITDKERQANLDQAEEHLRRALIEPPQIALESRLEIFLEEYEEYEEEMIPNERKYGVDTITDHEQIRADIKKIQEYLNEGRKRKGTNIWNTTWEEGVELFNRGYELAVELHGRIKSYKEQYFANKFTYDKTKESKRTAIILFCLATVAAIIIAFLFSDLPKLVFPDIPAK